MQPEPKWQDSLEWTRRATNAVPASGYADNLRQRQAVSHLRLVTGIIVLRVSRCYPDGSFSCPVQSTF